MLFCSLALVVIWVIVTVDEERSAVEVVAGDREGSPLVEAGGAVGSTEQEPSTVLGTGGVSEGDDVIEVLSVARLRELIARSTVTFELLDANSEGLPPVHGVLVSSRGATVLARLTPLLGATSGVCRVNGIPGEFDVVGAIEIDPRRDLVLVRVARRLDDSWPEALDRPDGDDVEAPGLGHRALAALRGEEASEALVTGLDVLVASPRASALTHISEFPFFCADGVHRVRLASAAGLPAEPLVAVDLFGYVVGLCVPGETDVSGGPRRVLIDPLGGLLGDGRRDEQLRSLAQLTAEFYAGTFTAFVSRATRSLEQRDFEAACESLFRALKRGARERLRQEVVDRAREMLGRALVLLSAKLERDGAIAELVSYLERAIEHLPEQRELWMGLAASHSRLSSHENAIRAAQGALELGPGADVDSVLEASYLGLARPTLAAGNLDAAAQILLEGIDLVPRSARLLLELAKIYRRREYYEDASRVFRMALELDPELEGEVALYLEHIDEAIRRKEAVIIPKRPGSNRFETSALVNGTVNLRFLFDTGADLTAISPAMAEALGIDWSRAPKVGVTTASSRTIARLVYLDSIAIQGFTVRNLKVLVLNVQTGLLGMNFLNHFKYTFDSARGDLILQRR